MAKKMPPAVCRLPAADRMPNRTKCATVKGLTLCEGDAVVRTLKTLKARPLGVVMAVYQGEDNRGRKKQAASVCFAHDEPGDLAYPYLFEELKKA